ncbi:hypothetical protein QA808_18320 [Streptomyces sp. B21-089]|uniref:hypothetical protein n=1 Tax=Streptomyces sp. B21-089 TaxID=3039412 RepID=UPI002FF33D4D
MIEGEGRGCGASEEDRVFVLYTIITSPERSADLVQIGFEGVSSAAQGVGDFMSELVK